MKINIKQIAHDHGITIKQLAKEINVSERCLYKWQTGETHIKAKYFIRLLIFTKENSIDFLNNYCILN